MSTPARQCGRGFTLVELLVSLGIMILILATAVYRFSSFDNTILLKTLTYDIALSVRTVQSYSIGVYGTVGGSFRYPYGLSFTPGATMYPFFAYLDTDPSVRPYYETGNVNVIDTYQLGRRFVISDVCIVVSGTENCDIDRLDISFRRPEYTALFYADGYGGNQANIESGIIRVQSSDATVTGNIEVGYTGNVTVSLTNP